MQANAGRIGYHLLGSLAKSGRCGGITRCKLMQDALVTTYKITKLIKKLPVHHATFKKLREEMQSDSPGIHVLSPTRWTVRPSIWDESLKSILNNVHVDL